MRLTDRIRIRLERSSPHFETPWVVVSPLTSRLEVRLRRPTTVAPMVWDANATLRVSLIYRLGGVEHVCVGQTSGGLRTDRRGVEITEYRLVYNPTVLLAQRTKDRLARAIPDAEGYYYDVPLTRIGELADVREAHLVLELLRGDSAETEILLAMTTDSPAPLLPRHKNSVAFDAATDVQELAGDGVVSLSHTAGSPNPAAFVGVGNSAGGGGSLGEVTYGGSGMTELWDATYASGFLYAHAGYALAGVAASAQTVTSDLVSTTPDEHAFGVITMTGVDQTTPVGTPATATGQTTSPTVTVGSVGADDLVCANVYWHEAGSGIELGTVGADQTEWTREVFATSDNITQSISTQPGTAGGVMSWAGSGSAINWGIGGVAFKPAAAGGGHPAMRRHGGVEHGARVGAGIY